MLTYIPTTIQSTSTRHHHKLTYPWAYNLHVVLMLFPCGSVHKPVSSGFCRDCNSDMVTNAKTIKCFSKGFDRKPHKNFLEGAVMQSLRAVANEGRGKGEGGEWNENGSKEGITSWTAMKQTEENRETISGPKYCENEIPESRANLKEGCFSL